MSDETKPYIEKKAHDPLRADDWNNMQIAVKEDIAHIDKELGNTSTKITNELTSLSEKLKSHDHSGDNNGVKLSGTAINDGAIEGKHISKNADLMIKDLTTTGKLTANNIESNIIKDLTRKLNDLTTRLTELERRKTFINSIFMEFVLIPSGKFIVSVPSMSEGSKGSQDYTRSINEPFYLAKYPVTIGQWKAVMHSVPNLINPGIDQKDLMRPVVGISGNDCLLFIKELKKMSGESEKKYFLPTEDHWEYACRAGTQTKYYFGENSNILNDYAFFNQSPPKNRAIVGSKKPNPWGLYDMYGNVWEWCHKITYYSDNLDVTNDVPTDINGEMALRGGSHINNSDMCNSVYREFDKRNSSNNLLYGFRLALAL